MVFKILTDNQNVSDKICEKLNGNFSGNCLDKDQIKTLLAKNQVTDKNQKVYLSNDSSKFFETNIFYVLFVVSLLMTSIVIATRKYHIKFSSDYTNGIQKLTIK